MKNTLKIDFDKKIIEMDKTFAARVKDTRSEEYLHLQAVRKDYPTYTVTTRKIKSNPNKETYRGLTYARMEDYILSHGNDAEVQEALAKYRHLREIAKCHKGKGYPVIKQWFLERYPEIEDFGIAS